MLWDIHIQPDEPTTLQPVHHVSHVESHLNVHYPIPVLCCCNPRVCAESFYSYPAIRSLAINGLDQPVGCVHGTAVLYDATGAMQI